LRTDKLLEKDLHKAGSLETMPATLLLKKLNLLSQSSLTWGGMGSRIAGLKCYFGIPPLPPNITPTSGIIAMFMLVYNLIK
jgi:hypothetical protein